MREILFRGKRLNGGGWISGNLVRFNNLAYIYTTDTCLDRVEVDPETVTQFVGEEDINGFKIFDGDVLSVNIHRHGSGQNWYSTRNKHHGDVDAVSVKVVWSEHNKGWRFQYMPETQDQIREIEKPRGQERQHQSVSVPTGFWRNLECEVIGTIYDK